jgi:hypothetical protein
MKQTGPQPCKHNRKEDSVGPKDLKMTGCCGGATTKGRGRGGGYPTIPTNATAPKLWLTTCTSTPGEHDLRGEEADPEGPTSLARRSGGVDSSWPLERTSTSSEREADRPAECGVGGPAAEEDATWVGPPPTDDPPDAARAATLTDEEPSKLLKTPVAPISGRSGGAAGATGEPPGRQTEEPSPPAPSRGRHRRQRSRP